MDGLAGPVQFSFTGYSSSGAVRVGRTREINGHGVVNGTRSEREVGWKMEVDWSGRLIRSRCGAVLEGICDVM